MKMLSNRIRMQFNNVPFLASVLLKGKIICNLKQNKIYIYIYKVARCVPNDMTAQDINVPMAPKSMIVIKLTKNRFFFT